MRIIGLDVGEKRIGVAKADSDTRIAIPSGFIVVDGSEWQEIAKIAKLNNTSFYVLGLPRSNEGNETAQTVYVRQFAMTLAKKLPEAKIRFQDESFTSVEAESRLKERKKKYGKGDIDAEAASIILQDFIEGFKENNKIDKNDEKEKGDKEDDKNSTKPTSPEKKVEKIVEKFGESSKNVAKKEADKLAFGVKKARLRSKNIRRALIISPIFLVVVLLGLTTVFKIRDFIRQQREEENARIEAEMKAATFNFTIRPGETLSDIKKHLLAVDRNGESTDEERVPNYTEAEIEDAFNAHYDFDFMDARPEGASLEGYLYPETYNFYSKSSVKDVLTVFIEKMGETIRGYNLAERYLMRGLTLHDGVTLASIVQKESPSGEQPTVAQVFLTRLDLGMTLGSDVTVSYALDLLDPNREIYSDNAAALAVDSCYNTRIYSGLPCGPISNPGLSALLAVAEPSDTSYLYFLTGDDGMMYYSSTEYEHTQNIYSHCQELCNVSL